MAIVHTEQIFNDLKDQIIKGVYPPAFSLTEIELAQKYGVSRNTIKKSLMMLENEGLVYIERNKGARVRVYSIDEVLEFLEVREELEGFIVRNAVKHISDEQTQDLTALMERMKDLLEQKNLLAYSQCNQQFHQIIYDACTNRTAVDVTTQLKNQMRKYNSRTILVPGRDLQSCSEHIKILEAVQARDEKAAELCMRIHIRNVSKTFQDNYEWLF